MWFAWPQWFSTPGPTKDESEGMVGGTRQGRVTCKGPPVQTYPPQIKGTICSEWGPDGVIVWVDLSQAELRTAALLSGDETLLQFFLGEGGDLHSERAIEIFGTSTLVSRYGESFLEEEGFRKVERQCGKTVNFADLFRAGPPRLRDAVFQFTGVEYPLPLFERIVRQRPETRPGLWAWQEELIKEARQKKYLFIPLTGQTRGFRGGKYDVNEIVNFPVQTVAGDLMLAIQAVVRRRADLLNQRRPWVKMFTNTYDALGLDVRRSHLHQVKVLISESIREVATSGFWGILQSLYGHEVPLEYDFKIAPTPLPS